MSCGGETVGHLRALPTARRPDGPFGSRHRTHRSSPGGRFVAPREDSTCPSHDHRSPGGLARPGPQARLDAVLRGRGRAVPARGQRAPLAAAGRVARLGRAVPDLVRRVRARAAATREPRSRRCATRSGARPVWRAARPRRGWAAVKLHAAALRARRVRGGGRQPARGALRPRQRLAHHGGVRRARRAPPHPDPAAAHARARAARTAQFDWTHRLLSHRTTGSRSRRATPSTSCCSAPTRSSSRSPPTSCSRPGSRICSSSACPRWPAQVGDHLFEAMVTSIQTDEARHAQIGRPVLRSRRSSTIREYAQYLVDKWFWRSWLLFAVVTGFAMDYLTPLERRTELVQGVRAGVGPRAVPGARSRSVGLRAAVVLGHVPPSARLLPPHGLRERLHLSRDGVVRLRGARVPTSAAWLRRKYPRDVAGDSTPVWERITAALAARPTRASTSRCTARAIVGFCNLCQLVLCQRHARSTTTPWWWSTSGRTLRLLLRAVPVDLRARAGALRGPQGHRASACSPARRPATWSRFLTRTAACATRRGARTPTAASTRGSSGEAAVMLVPLYGFVGGRHDRAARARSRDDDDRRGRRQAADVGRGCGSSRGRVALICRRAACSTRPHRRQGGPGRPRPHRPAAGGGLRWPGECERSASTSCGRGR